MFIRVFYHPDDREYVGSNFMKYFSQSTAIKAYDYTQLSKAFVNRLLYSKGSNFNRNIIFIISGKTAKDDNYNSFIGKFQDCSNEQLLEYAVLAFNNCTIDKNLNRKNVFFLSSEIVNHPESYKYNSSMIIQEIKEIFSKTSEDNSCLEKTKHKRVKLIWIGYLIMVIGTLIYFLSFVARDAMVFTEVIRSIIHISGFAVMCTGGMLCFLGMLFRYIGTKEDVKKELDLYSDKLKSTSSNYDNINVKDIDDPEDSKMDALALMQINLENIKEYYVWSQRQAKLAFGLAVGMSIGGFILLVTSVISMLINNTGLEVAIISAVGGAVVELIAGTALFVYKGSLNQLNHYHQTLHEDERFLSSVNLINKFSSEEKADSMLEEIIRSEIQMNLTSVGYIDNDKKGE